MNGQYFNYRPLPLHKIEAHSRNQYQQSSVDSEFMRNLYNFKRRAVRETSCSCVNHAQSRWLLETPITISYCLIGFQSVCIDSPCIPSSWNSASTDFGSELLFCVEEGNDSWSTDYSIIILFIYMLFADHLSYWPLHLFDWPFHLF